MPSHLLRSGPVALAPAYLGPSPPHNHHSKRAPRAAPRTALPLAGRSSPPQSNPPRLPHGSQTPRPTCSRGPVRPGWTEGDQALSHPPPLGGAPPAAALSVRAATGGAGARGCRRMIREVAPGGTSTSTLVQLVPAPVQVPAQWRSLHALRDVECSVALPPVYG